MKILLYGWGRVLFAVCDDCIGVCFYNGYFDF